MFPKNISIGGQECTTREIRRRTFRHPYIDLEKMNKVYNSKEHKALALKAAHEAMVLLKNEKNILPLDAAKIKTLAVIGPDAADIHLGGTRQRRCEA